MIRTIANHGRRKGSLTDQQWNDLMRSLIEDADDPLDEASDLNYLQEVAARDDSQSSLRNG